MKINEAATAALPALAFTINKPFARAARTKTYTLHTDLYANKRGKLRISISAFCNLVMM